mmetsp:Transcript_411/g.1357  ORF Transcript_411/g.1357 Transcript_411/m.1357 type:complete len:363 (+) Transcript_411:98-1186(+)
MHTRGVVVALVVDPRSFVVRSFRSPKRNQVSRRVASRRRSRRRRRRRRGERPRHAVEKRPSAVFLRVLARGVDFRRGVHLRAARDAATKRLPRRDRDLGVRRKSSHRLRLLRRRQLVLAVRVLRVRVVRRVRGRRAEHRREIARAARRGRAAASASARGELDLFDRRRRRGDEIARRARRRRSRHSRPAPRRGPANGVNLRAAARVGEREHLGLALRGGGELFFEVRPSRRGGRGFVVLARRRRDDGSANEAMRARRRRVHGFVSALVREELIRADARGFDERRDVVLEALAFDDVRRALGRERGFGLPESNVEPAQVRGGGHARLQTRRRHLGVHPRVRFRVLHRAVRARVEEVRFERDEV